MNVIFVLFLTFVGVCCGLNHFPQCEKISLTVCQNLGYNTTLMPNFVGHNTQFEASKGVCNIIEVFRLII